MTPQQLYVAQYLFRIYAPVGTKDRILGVNVCFHNQPQRLFPEPIFVVANTSYIPEPLTREEELVRTYDPWAAHLDWAADKSFGKPLEVEPFRSTIQKIVIAAVLVSAHISILSRKSETSDCRNRQCL
jgi:hypothetical protein